jgi:N-6 DNA Methylase
VTPTSAPTPGDIDLGPYDNFLESVEASTNETSIRESFVTLAATAFADSAFARELALGAEHAVSFRQGGLIRRGRVDSFVDNVLIEFKADIRSQQERWLNQLRGYVAGAWAEDEGYERAYIAVLTDGVRWQVHAATPINATLGPDSDNVELVLIDEWSRPLSGDEVPRSLAHFLNRLFFRQTLLAPTAGNFSRDFGVQSSSFVTVSARLREALEALSGEPQMTTHRDAWAEDIRTSYGGGDTPTELFIRHTYLALLARLLLFAALERRPLTAADSASVLDGTYFQGRRIGNVVEDDYFQWPLLASRSRLSSAWAGLVNQLAGYDLATISEDVLKPLYEQLVDPETRHDLGEYYTPDWLAREVVEATLEPWLEAGLQPRVLDPTCGSGSFLRAVIDRRRQSADPAKAPAVILAEVLDGVVGMDVNPLAVIVAKATYLLAIADLIPHAPDIVHVPVYLCNSLSAQQRRDTASLFGDSVALSVGDTDFDVPLELVHAGTDYDFAISTTIAVARSFAATGQKPIAAAAGVRARLQDLASRYVQGELLLNSLSAMSVRLVELIRSGRDTIHGFLLRNKYRSVLLYRHFDVVVGNPPWLTIADVTAPNYRALVLQRVQETQIAARAVGEQAHTELATLFMAQVFRQFLSARPGDELPQLGFVMPRSIFSATHHRRLRQGAYSVPFQIIGLWDLSGVDPLFNVPSCVVLARSGPPRPTLPIDGRLYTGRLPTKDPDRRTTLSRIRREEVRFVLAQLGSRSAWVVEGESTYSRWGTAEGHASTGSPYQARFRQGAVLYPQTLLGVLPLGAHGRGGGDVAVETDPLARTDAKVLANVELHGVVERSCLFSTAAAEHLLPYAVRPDLWTVVLPTLTDPGQPDFCAVEPDVLRKHGRIGTADWFDNADRLWRESSSKPAPPLWERVDYLGHLSAQKARSQWIVLYTSAGSRPVAAVLDGSSTEFPFVARDQTYWASFYDQDEAHYVAAMLNSDQTADRIRAFMTTGLFGPRHIHKRVLDVPVPTFDTTDNRHAEIAKLGGELSGAAEKFVRGITNLHSARKQVRQFLPQAALRRVEELASAILDGTGP